MASDQGRLPDAPCARAHSARVLLIDDEEVVLRAWTRWLHRFGLEVWTARSARDAVSPLDRFQGEFDAVACDLHMADGGGMELYRFLEAKYPGAEHRVVFITGGTVSVRETEFLQTVGNPVLQKPYGLEQLVMLALEWAQRRQTHCAGADESL